MTEVITAIQNALGSDMKRDKLTTSLAKALDSSDFLWRPDYPIALIDAKGRVDQDKDILLFENRHLFDEMGKTPGYPSQAQLDTIAEIGMQYLQCVSIMCLHREPDNTPLFQTKRKNDYWKKIQDVAHIKSMVEISEWHDDVEVCSVEFALREIIRKRKEVHALKDVGFVWIAATTSDVSNVFQHYFHDNYIVVKTEEQVFHLGWSSTLRAISMRSFVCPPK